MSVLEGFDWSKKEKPPRVIREEQIDKSGARAFFDGARQGDPPISGVGVLYLFNDHILKFKDGLGRGTNNLAKLMASKLLKMLVVEKGAQKSKFLEILLYL
jgi:hypothetical protein